ncbi:S-adenosyl-L-methionine-dependent methyltransferase superfamily protein [Abortiporus biennis]
MASTEKDTWSAKEYNDKASFVYSDKFTSPVLTLLDPKPGERIIDFGCGSGELTLKLEHIVGDDGLVIGIDASESMISKAKENGLQHAFVHDIQKKIETPAPFSVPLINSFDAVFTNAALHWCKRDPKGVLESAKSVLKPGGRFVGEMGGFLNVVGVRSAIHSVLRKRGYDPLQLDPWYFPSSEAYTKLLTSAGFSVKSIGLHPRITPLPGPLYDWVWLFGRESYFSGFSDEEAREICNEVQSICETDCRDESGKWSIMYSRLRLTKHFLE